MDRKYNQIPPLSRNEAKKAVTGEKNWGELLARKGINPEEHRHLFPILRRSERPLLGRLIYFPYLNLFSRAEFAEILNEWKGLENSYAAIDSSEQTEATGKNIIEAMKSAWKNFILEIEDNYVPKLPADPNTNLPDPTPRMQKLYEEILDLAQSFKNLPAYIAYSEAGRFDLGHNGLRGFESEDRSESGPLF